MDVQTLELRRMLSAALSEQGVLVVTGTANSDAISIHYNTAGDHVIVDVGGEESSFAAADVQRINVDALAGDDAISLDTKELASKISGGDGNDTITSIDGIDEIGGGAGDDSISAGGGDDLLDGGSGADTLDGGAGADTADYSARTENLTLTLNNIADDGAAGEHDNILHCENINGGDGNDLIIGDAKGNQLEGFGGYDTIRGKAGDDAINAFYQFYTTKTDDGAPSFIDGGSGNDGIGGGAGPDKIFGDGGQDFIFGEDGNDYIDGGSGDDFIEDGKGNDTVFGQGGNDTGMNPFEPFNVISDMGTDYVDAGSGDDTWRMETLDTVPGKHVGDQFFGRGGDDALLVAFSGSTGSAEYSGGSGPDHVTIASTNKALVKISLDDKPNDGLAGETLNVHSDFEDIENPEYPGGPVNLDASMLSKGITLYGSNMPDTLIGSQAADRIIGFGNDDTIDGQGGEDVLLGGDGNDRLIGGSGEDVLDGGLDNDTLLTKDGERDTVSGGVDSDEDEPGDTVTADAGLDVLVNVEVIL